MYMSTALFIPQSPPSVEIPLYYMYFCSASKDAHFPSFAPLPMTGAVEKNRTATAAQEQRTYA
jgi:hypothetical protein